MNQPGVNLLGCRVQMSVEEAMAIVEVALDPKSLSQLQARIFQGAWEGKTYQQIAIDAGYDDEYIKAIGARLWQLLSRALSTKVTKSNFTTVIRDRARSFAPPKPPSLSANSSDRLNRAIAQGMNLPTLSSDIALVPPVPVATLKLPVGQVPLDSAFYIERPPIESRCYEHIEHPGALVRIKAPRQMGKTSLMARILQHARTFGSQVVPLSCQLADASVFASTDRFLQWFCASVTRHLGLPNRLLEYWDDMLGSSSNTTVYFEEYILSHFNVPLVLGLDELDRLFRYPDIATDFFGLLRAWYEKAHYGDARSYHWGKFRAIAVHSTEAYIPLDPHQSLFNVGLSWELPPFNAAQVRELARRHGLHWSERDVTRLMALVGGHPYLVRLTLYEIARQSATLEQIIADPIAERGLYGDVLRRLWQNLQCYPDLAAAFARVTRSNQPVALDPAIANRLQGLGLVQRWGNECQPSCYLYRQYFRAVLKETLTAEPDCVAQLTETERDLAQLVNIDELTQLANRRGFNEYLHSSWQRSAIAGEPLSVILFDIDFFKAYNDTYGHVAGDECLRQLSRQIACTTVDSGLVDPANSLLARYGGEEFVLVLPDTELETAVRVTETIRLAAKALQVVHSDGSTGSVTVSLGVCTCVADLETSAIEAVIAADRALYQAKTRGRDLWCINTS